MWSNMIMGGITSAISEGVSYINAKKQAKQERKWQEYNNAMTRLADAHNQNALTENEILLNGRTADQRFQMNRQSYKTMGEAESSAAAADTEGRSVNAVLFDVGRNNAMSQQRLQADLEAQYLSIDAQRKNSAFQMATNIDHSFIPGPSLATSMMNFTRTMGNTYEKYGKT